MASSTFQTCFAKLCWCITRQRETGKEKELTHASLLKLQDKVDMSNLEGILFFCFFFDNKQQKNN